MQNALWAAAFGLILLFQPCAASAAPVAPERHVQSTIDQVRAVVDKQQDKGSPVLDARLKEILFPLFDFEKMSRASLGPNWDKATPDEQHRFVTLFSDLLARTYLKRIKSGVSGSRIEVGSASVDGPKATVKTTVTSDGQPVAIDYRMEASGDVWRVYDVLIENVGLVSNYRSEFGEIVRKDGMQGLLEKLEAKAKNEKTS